MCSARQGMFELLDRAVLLHYCLLLGDIYVLLANELLFVTSFFVAESLLITCGVLGRGRDEVPILDLLTGFGGVDSQVGLKLGLSNPFAKKRGGFP